MSIPSSFALSNILNDAEEAPDSDGTVEDESPQELKPLQNIQPKEEPTDDEFDDDKSKSAPKAADMSRLPLIQRSRRDYKKIYSKLFQTFKLAMLESEILYHQDVQQRRYVQFLTQRNNSMLDLLDTALDGVPRLQGSVEQLNFWSHNHNDFSHGFSHGDTDDTSILLEHERVRLEAISARSPALKRKLAPLFELSSTLPIIHPAPVRSFADLSAADMEYTLQEAVPLTLTTAEMNEANPMNSIQWMKRNHNDVLQMLSSVGVANNSGGINGTHHHADKEAVRKEVKKAKVETKLKAPGRRKKAEPRLRRGTNDMKEDGTSKPKKKDMKKKIVLSLKPKSESTEDDVDSTISPESEAEKPEAQQSKVKEKSKEAEERAETEERAEVQEESQEKNEKIEVKIGEVGKIGQKVEVKVEEQDAVMVDA
ncbi:hypothetical protein BABINDRAFT_162108 [Babjeviella inositovora NRRL Y-12698]|uniref:Uncharacterized protein n=1 Tax=Babjeviella inositovora NRRL Y-12698 TaxID=984486 RepID=A0A1E3QN25_9ASCO|nr:uncharacterized protein BABINDRAFT_162108 [Babjeviella inositovora NRRL Y-12698]ODQ79038.1 hypothetical protein BABINDRAFT_162108 [Babjeviella inositovora NRRL Y-12698]